MSALVIERCGPLVTVQARGRRGHAHEGIPASGPWDPEVFAAALAAVGGADDHAALEIPLNPAQLRVEGRALVSIDGEPARTIVDAVLEIPSHARAVRYVAVAGGLDVPVVLGSRATFPNAGFGGFEGRALRRGDRLSVGEAHDAPRSVEPLRDGLIELLPTADADPRALEALLATMFVIDARSDRVGTRLVPERPLAFRAQDGLSRPVVRGAVQLPPDGRPIVLGPDGPTTGGYPLVGVLDRASQGRLARIRPGGVVRFRQSSVVSRQSSAESEIRGGLAPLARTTDD